MQVGLAHVAAWTAALKFKTYAGRRYEMTGNEGSGQARILFRMSQRALDCMDWATLYCDGGETHLCLLCGHNCGRSSQWMWMQ